MPYRANTRGLTNLTRLRLALEAGDEISAPKIDNPPAPVVQSPTRGRAAPVRAAPR